MKPAALTVAFALAVASARAACPNSCSGHGTCNEYDSCTCYTNWEGGDCSSRVCAYNTAWVTTPQGDLNYDGDTFDGTAYNPGYAFTTSTHLITDAAPGGTWESWPSFATASQDEGHFYMECSNRGICDRSNGLCKCFDGYEGESCHRQTCSKGCNGHGVCKSISQLLDTYNSDNDASRTYALWDKDMARACVCDPGYQGHACQERICPKGDDPLTTTHQYDDVHFIDIYSAVTPPVSDQDLGGTATFTFTDAYGKSYTTDPIAIQTYDLSANADLMATNLKAALEGFEGTPIPSVTVTAGYCEKALPAEVAYGTTVISTPIGGHNYVADLTGVISGKYLRCAGAVQTGPPTSQADLVWFGTDDSVILNTVAGTGAPEGIALAERTTTASVTCHEVTQVDCVRFTITFDGNPGPQNQLVVDTSAVTRNSVSGTAAQITQSRTKSLEVVSDALAQFAYALPSSVVEVSDGKIHATIKTTINAAARTDWIVFPVGTTVAVWCNSKSLGEYTVVTSANNQLVVDRDIIDPQSECTDGAVGSGYVTLKLVSEYITTNVDVTNLGLTGKRISITGFDSNAMLVVASATYDATVTDVNDAGVILLTGTSGQSTAVTGVAGQSLTILGTSTKENAECSDRGICNRESATCKCFKGYTGLACGTQNALSA